MKESVRKFFRQIAEDQQGNYNPESGRLTSLAGETQAHVLRSVENIIRPLKLSIVLDVGSGPGRYMQVYGRKGVFHILVDGISQMLDIAKKRAAKLGLTDSTDFIVADIERLPIRGNSCDFVSCIDTLHHLEQPSKASALAELGRVALENGYVFVEIKNKLFPHYLLGFSRRNPAGVSIPSNYIWIRSLFQSDGFLEVYSTGALPWGLASKIVSPSILMGFKKASDKNDL